MSCGNLESVGTELFIVTPHYPAGICRLCSDVTYPCPDTDNLCLLHFSSNLGLCSFHQLSWWVDSLQTYEFGTELIKVSDLFSRHSRFPREKVRVLS